METPTTLREEIRQLLAASTVPMTRSEIFKKCRLPCDESTLSTVLSQLCAAGDIKNAGKRETIGERAQLLFTRRIHESAGISGGGRVKARKPRKAKPAPKKRGPYKKRAKPAKTRSPRLPKVQRRNADSRESLTPGFRCGLYSDGSMDIERAGEVFQLSEPEVRALFAYLEKLPEVRRET